MMAMQKTEKTMAELQIDLNMSFEFDKITESGESLQPLSGPRWVSMTLIALLPRLFGMHCFCKTRHRDHPMPCCMGTV